MNRSRLLPGTWLVLAFSVFWLVGLIVIAGGGGSYPPEDGGFRWSNVLRTVTSLVELPVFSLFALIGLHGVVDRK